MPLASTRPRRLPPGKSRSSALSGTRQELRARWPAGTGAARVHRCSKTSTRPFSHRSRGRPGRVRFHDFCRWLFQRARPWTARTPRATGIRGRDCCRESIDRRQSIVAAAEGTRGQGQTITESSAFPHGIAPVMDFAPTSIASDTSCRGHHAPTCPELARETISAARATHASKACAAPGPCSARSPRRDQAFTSPRGLPS